MRQILIIPLIIYVTALCASTRELPKTNRHVVRIEGMRFIPKLLEVKAGETVHWINESGSSHNVIANDGSFKSEMLDDKGDKFEYTFKKEGEIHYYCQPHQMMGMKGTIIVKK
jgi:plastocyanin